MGIISNLFGGPKPNIKTEGGGDITIYSADRVIEMVSDNNELAVVIQEYVNLQRHISFGGRAENDTQLIAEQKENIIKQLAQQGIELEKQPSHINADIDDSIANFVALFQKTYGQAEVNHFKQVA